MKTEFLFSMIEVKYFFPHVFLYNVVKETVQCTLFKTNITKNPKVRTYFQTTVWKFWHRTFPACAPTLG